MSDKKKIPSPPIEVYELTFFTQTDKEPGEPEKDFDKANRILDYVEKTHRIPISTLFHLFDRKIGFKTDVEQLLEIFRSYSPEIVQQSFQEMISVCQGDDKYKEKIKSYFLNSLKRFVVNRAHKLLEQQQIEKVSSKYGVIPEEGSPSHEFEDFMRTVFQEEEIWRLFSKVYRCKCGREISIEVDKCPGCDALLNWEKAIGDEKIHRRKRQLITKAWIAYSAKFKTEKNYGDWPNSIHTPVHCTKCKNGTIIEIDSNGEEYTDYCDCQRQNKTTEDFRSKLIKANIPKDFWFLTTNSYINPSSYSYDQIQNELNIQIVKRYIDNIDKHIENGRSLYLFGDNNTGKTMFMCIILKEALKMGYSVIFKTMSEIITGYMKNWFEKQDISYFKECHLLGVDDSFDRRKTYTSENKMQISQIDDLFRHRIHHWKSTIITANIAIDDVDGNDSILNINLVRLLSRKMLPLTFRGDYTVNLQNRLKGEIVG